MKNEGTIPKIHRSGSSRRENQHKRVALGKKGKKKGENSRGQAIRLPAGEESAQCLTYTHERKRGVGEMPAVQRKKKGRKRERKNRKTDSVT